MTPTDRIEEAPGQARIVARSDVLVVGGGPSGLESDGGDRLFAGGGPSRKVRAIRRPRR